MGCCATPRAKEKEDPETPDVVKTLTIKLKEKSRKKKRVSAISSGAATPRKIPELRILKEPISSLYHLEAYVKLNKKKALPIYIEKNTFELVTLTVYPKPKSKKLLEARAEFAAEAKVFLSLDHPGLLKCRQLLEDSWSFAIVWEPVKGDALMNYAGQVNPGTVAKLAVQFFEVFSYCHKRDVKHLRLQPSHLLLKDPAETQTWTVKLTGLDEAGMVLGKELETDSVSPYIAPEVYADEGLKASDLWSCGVAIWNLVTGSLPFSEEEYAAALKTPGSLQFQFDEEVWSAHAPLQDLVASLLQWDPASRPTAIDSLQHPYIASKRGPQGVYRDLVKSLAAFARSDSRINQFKMIIRRFLLDCAQGKPEINALREVFRQLDVDGDGFLTATELQAGFSQVLSNKEAEVECERILKAADFNGNGEMDYTEFLVASYTDDELFSIANIREAFQRLDTNGSGTVHIDEMMAMFHCSTKVKRTLKAHFLKLREGDTSEMNFDGFLELLMKAAV